jgi:hypothetical protein
MGVSAITSLQRMSTPLSSEDRDGGQPGQHASEGAAT